MSEQRGRRRLPEGQPWRALSVVALYVVAVTAAYVPFVLLFGTPLGWLILFALACLLAVPVAVAAPRQKDLPAPTSDRPVLLRPDAASHPSADYET